MKLRIISRMLLISAIVLLPLIASALDPRPICQVCRRYIDKSPQACSAFIMLGGKHPRNIEACSLFCLFEQLEKYESEPESYSVTNYSTINDEYVQQLSAKQAVFLFDAEGDNDLSQEPHIFAFSNEENAKAAQEELGGEILKWAEVKERCTKLAAEWEPKKAKERESGIPNPKNR